MRPSGRYALFLLLTAPATLAAQETFSVFVGINDYMELQGESGGDLQGAERDAQLLREVLIERWGLRAENSRTLLSLEATKDAIRESITGWLATRAGPGDLAIFYFAGHGSQVFDLDGDEPDGLDETIAPTDIMLLSSERDIRDDELRAWLETIPAQVLVILDSCHSGTATRGTGAMRPRVLDRPIPPEGGNEPDVVRQRYDSESMADGSTSIIELAAAGPNQSAMEGAFRRTDGQDPEQRGAFTYHLVQALWQVPPTTTYEGLISRVVSSMKADQFTQDPQLEGPMRTTLFTVGQAKAMTVASPAGTVEVLAVRGAAVTLRGGRAQGRFVGSMYATEGGAVLEVVSVAGDTSEAAVVSGLPTVGESASLSEVALTSPTLAVDASYLPTDARAALIATLSDLEGVELADGSEAPDLYLRISEDEGALEVLGRDGGVRTLVPWDGSAGSVGPELRRALDKELAARRLAALNNPTTPFDLDLAFEGDAGVFEAGRERVVSVTTEVPGFLTLVDLAPDGVATVLHPRPGSDFGRLAAGRPVTVRADAGDRRDDRAGFGLLLAIVTPSPLGLEPTPAGGMRSGAELAGEMRDRLRAVTRESGSASKWTARLLSYDVVARR